MKDKQLHHFRTILERQKQKLQKRQDVTDHRELRQSMTTESVGELSNYDNHPADTGSEMYEREKDMALDLHDRQELEDIEQALQAVDKGTYGICEVCGEEIPAERLEAVPTATRCREHAQDETITNRRPAEEDIIPETSRAFQQKESEEQPDGEDAWQELAEYGTSDTPSDYMGPHEHDYAHGLEQTLQHTREETVPGDDGYTVDPPADNETMQNKESR